MREAFCEAEAEPGRLHGSRTGRQAIDKRAPSYLRLVLELPDPARLDIRRRSERQRRAADFFRVRPQSDRLAIIFGLFMIMPRCIDRPRTRKGETHRPPAIADLA